MAAITGNLTCVIYVNHVTPMLVAMKIPKDHSAQWLTQSFENGAKKLTPQLTRYGSQAKWEEAHSILNSKPILEKIFTLENQI